MIAGSFFAKDKRMNEKSLSVSSFHKKVGMDIRIHKLRSE